jgi:Spy/CpxP family protein refolding chaperone
MRTRMMAAVLSAGVATLSASVWAQSIDVPQGRWWQRPRVAGALGLTPDQVQKLDATTLAHARTMIDLKAAVERAELDLRATAEAEPFQAARVQTAFAALQAARNRLENERFEMLLNVREVLTGEQWHKLREFARRRADELGERGAKPSPGPDRPFRRWRN